MDEFLIVMVTSQKKLLGGLSQVENCKKSDQIFISIPHILSLLYH